MRASVFDLYFQTGTSSILIVIYLVVLIRALKGSGFKFVIQLCGLLLVYNLAVIARYWSLKAIIKSLDNDLSKNSIISWLVAEASALVIQWACFNLAHWFFAYQYFEIARQTPFLKANEDVPQNILKCDKAINKTMITLNIFFPLMYGISTFQWNYIEIYIGEKPLWLVIGARLLINVIVFLQIVSGTFVGYALFKIKQSINKEDASIVNVKTMTFHLLAFGIYTFSALIN